MTTVMINYSNSAELKGCTVLGGFGYPFSAGDTLELTFSANQVLVTNSDGRKEDVPFIEILDLTITGPGNVKTGGGFIGGGFGVEQAIEGIAIAAVLNALTTRSKIHTFVSLLTHVGELHFHYSLLEPAALRIELSEVFTALRRLNSASIQSRIAILEMQLTAGCIDQAEFDRLKQRLLNPPKSKPPAERLGKCPSCSSTIQLLSESCPKCKASFGRGAAWIVKPI